MNYGPHPDDTRLGVPFTSLGKLSMVEHSALRTAAPYVSSNLAAVMDDAAKCELEFLQFHTSDGRDPLTVQVNNGVFEALRGAIRDPKDGWGDSLGECFVVGFTSEGGELLADSMEASPGAPFPNVYDVLERDRILYLRSNTPEARKHPSHLTEAYRPAFLPPREVQRIMSGGHLQQLYPPFFTHRLVEVDKSSLPLALEEPGIADPAGLFADSVRSSVQPCRLSPLGQSAFLSHFAINGCFPERDTDVVRTTPIKFQKNGGSLAVKPAKSPQIDDPSI